VDVRVSVESRGHEEVEKMQRFVSVEGAEDTKRWRKCGCTCQRREQRTRRSGENAEIRVSGESIGHEEVEKMWMYVSAERGEDTKEW